MTIALALFTGCGKLTHESGLHVEYGARGLNRLTFNGIILEDLERYPNDNFHIWHLQTVDQSNRPKKGNQYDWGEVNSGRTWDPAAHTWTYKFVWGQITARFRERRDEFSILVTEHNRINSGITLHGAAIYPLVLHFPELPEGFRNASFEHLAVGVDDAHPVAEYGSDMVTVLAETGGKPLYRGFEPAGSNNFVPILSSTPMDSLAAVYPKFNRPVLPGGSDTFSVSLRFKNFDN